MSVLLRGVILSEAKNLSTECDYEYLHSVQGDKSEKSQ